MKILILFCDMLRANRLMTVNKDISTFTNFDKWIQDFGGCTYTNCYTPAPDTPRSLACFYTGLYPKLNGCKLRIEWPRYYQNQEKPTIFELLNNSKYKTYTNFSKYELETGVLSNKDLKRVSNYNSFLDIFNSEVIRNKDKNSCFFLTLNDYHQCVNDYSSLKRADKKGHEKLLDTFDMFFKKYDKDIFDYIFIFSDHGCILSDDNLYLKDKYQLLNDNRSKIFLHIRKKGEINSHVDPTLRTIMDIYPSIAEILNNPIPKKISGISLFNKKSHEFVVIEDTCEFKPHLGIYNDIWRYKEMDYSYYLSIDDGAEVKYEKCNDLNKSTNTVNTKKILKRISDFSCSYKEINKRHEILISYAEMNRQYSNINFSSGEKRGNSLKIYFYKIYSIIIKIIRKLHFSFIKSLFRSIF